MIYNQFQLLWIIDTNDVLAYSLLDEEIDRKKKREEVYHKLIANHRCMETIINKEIT